jgi:hypothetical protein
MIETDEMFTTSRKPRKCPNCGSKRIANILYGPSHFYPEIQNEIEKGRVLLPIMGMRLLWNADV